MNWIYFGTVLAGFTFSMLYLRHWRLKNNELTLSLKALEEVEPLWTESFLLNTAHQLFQAAQEGWSKQNIEALKTIIHPELFGQWLPLILDQKLHHEHHLVKAGSFTQNTIVRAENYLDHESDNFTVCFRFHAHDTAMVDGKVVEDKHAPFTEYWTFEWQNGHWFVRDVTQEGSWRRFANNELVHTAHPQKAA